MEAPETTVNLERERNKNESWYFEGLRSNVCKEMRVDGPRIIDIQILLRQRLQSLAFKQHGLSVST